MSLRRKWRKVVEKNLELVKEITSYRERLNILFNTITGKDTNIKDYETKLKILEAECKALKKSWEVLELTTMMFYYKISIFIVVTKFIEEFQTSFLKSITEKRLLRE